MYTTKVKRNPFNLAAKPLTQLESPLVDHDRKTALHGGG